MKQPFYFPTPRFSYVDMYIISIELFASISTGNCLLLFLLPDSINWISPPTTTKFILLQGVDHKLGAFIFNVFIVLGKLENR